MTSFWPQTKDGPASCGQVMDMNKDPTDDIRERCRRMMRGEDMPLKPPTDFQDVQFGVGAEAPWVVLTLGDFGTLRLEPQNALELGRALKVAALKVKGKRKV